ncbi:MAG: hypothetical protein U5K51_04360 [Flavobacteriaceae bacterium]|nr:hypothetical protein [Flavobacteriaceae bacterium]
MDVLRSQIPWIIGVFWYVYRICDLNPYSIGLDNIAIIGYGLVSKTFIKTSF